MFKDVLSRHVGYVITINATNPAKLESCGLKALHEGYFSIVTQKDLCIHIPYTRILTVVENNDGGPIRINKGLMSSVETRIVINIEHMVIYSGSTGVGFQFPS